MNETPLRIGFMVTCLVDLFRPSVGFAGVRLLERAGCLVEVPVRQTCCGQPAFNFGDAKTACELAKHVIETFEGFDYIVLPSGSCAAMIRCHYPTLFDDDMWKARARTVAEKTFELTSFLVDVLKVDTVAASFDGPVTYHDSCSGLREMGIKDQPRTLLCTVDGLTLFEASGAEECCGFGGTFCVKYEQISNRMVSDKADNFIGTGAETVLGGDLGCLMNIAGKLSRKKASVKVRHVAEVLADMASGPAIGEGET